MQGTKRIAANTAFLYIRLVFVLIVSLFTVRIVLKSLGDIDYGIYNVVCGFVSMFGFFNTAMTNGVQRFYNYELGKNGDKSVARVYTSSLYIQIVLALLLIVIVECIGVWYVNTKMVIPAEKLYVANYIFQFSLIGLMLSFLQIPYVAVIVAYEKMNYFAFVGIIDAIAKLLIAYAIIVAPNRLLFYGGLLMLINVLDFFVFFIYARIHFKNLFFEKQRDNALIKEMLLFVSWNTFGSFAYVIRWQGVNVLMNAFFGVIVNAANGIASQISSALAYFSGNLVLAFKPQLTHSYASGNYRQTRYLLYLMTRMSYALVYTLSVPVILEINYILNLWLGDDAPEYTASFSILVIISVLIGCFHTPLVQVVHATGKIRLFQIITSVIITSILPVTWLCFRMGLNPNWAYWVTIIIYLINQIIGMIIVRKVFDYSYVSYIKEVVLRSLAFTSIVPILPFVLLNYMNTSFVRLIYICLITAGISLVATYGLMLSSEERDQIKMKLNRFVKNN